MPTMLHVNSHYQKLKAGYLFPEIGRRVNAFAEGHTGEPIIKLGIGDVTEPLPEACTQAMHQALDDMASREKFHGYGPEQGYAWLREKIATHDYQSRGCDIDAEEIFISDGSKCDSGNILDILGSHNTIAVCDPVYPVYVDTNVMAGHTGASGDHGYAGLVYIPMTADNGFAPAPPSEPVDLIYLCYPNNPTGATITKAELKTWVDYANANGALILFDAAYHAFITDDELPHSIFEIEGAKTCAIEFRSFSKNAGFTGTRCAFTVVPKDLERPAEGSEKAVSLHALWGRRQSTKFNGVSYIVQRGAEAVYSAEGQKQVDGLVGFYMENARLLREGLRESGFDVFGGVHAPYIWLKCPEGTGSWEFFDQLLAKTSVVGTPGAGFGQSGEGYFRLSAFNSRLNVETALDRIAKAELLAARA